MSVINTENIVGWSSKQGERFLCPDCFDKSGEKVVDWEPEYENENRIYVCDECNEEIRQ